MRNRNRIFSTPNDLGVEQLEVFTSSKNSFVLKNTRC